MTATRLRISKYILVQLILWVVHLECGFNQTTISYYLFVSREGSDETAHLRVSSESSLVAYVILTRSYKQSYFILYFISSYILKDYC